MFGGKYVITLDESWDAETPANRAEFLAKNEVWWYYEIKGRCGTAYPFSETEVAVVLPARAAHGYGLSVSFLASCRGALA